MQRQDAQVDHGGGEQAQKPARHGGHHRDRAVPIPTEADQAKPGGPADHDGSPTWTTAARRMTAGGRGSIPPISIRGLSLAS